MTALLRGRRLDLAWSAVLAVLVLAPLLVRRGVALRGDMVFVPDQPWKGAWLGLDGSVPRSVPMDAVVWALGLLAPGDVVQKVLLLAILVAAGAGAGRLVGARAWYARLAAVTMFVWNPWVLERLSIGQWAILGGYALLPWTALAAVRARDSRGHDWAPLAVALVLAGVCGPSSGLTNLAVALAVCLASGARTLLVAGGLGVVANLPWAVPALLVPGGVGSDGAAFTAFAPRAESALGTVASLVSLGGIWKSTVVPGERTSELVVAASCLVTVAALAGLRRAARTSDRGLVVALAAVGLAGLALALALSLGPVAGALDRAAAELPALALLRDGHRWVAPFALCLLPGSAAAVEWLVGHARDGREALVAVAGLVAVAPVLLLPGLALGLGGELRAVRYPQDWAEVADRIAAEPRARTVVLPWEGSYRRFAWNHHQAGLDPAPRFLPGPVLVDDRLFVDDRVIGAETSVQRELTRVLEGDRPSAERLGGLGVRWVVVEHGQPGLPDQLPEGGTAYEGAWLTLLDLGAATATEERRPPAAPIVAAHVLAGATLLLALLLLARHLV